MQNVILYGLNIYAGDVSQLITDIKNNKEKIHIISGSANVLQYPLKDKCTYQLFNEDRNIIIPDSISVYYPIRIKYKRGYLIPGIDLMEKLLFEFQTEEKSVYFLGAKEEIIDKMIHKFKIIYPKLQIVGYHHGYFDKNNCENIITEIKKSQAYALFVAFGAPTQENFILKYMDDLPCSFFMGVGGSFDVFSETVKRSPKWMRRLGLEWLYRFITSPKYLLRIWIIIKFTIIAIIKG